MTSIRRLLAGAALAIGITTMGADQAGAVAIGSTPSPSGSLSVRGTLTADNHYGVFYGNKDGSTLDFVGRNEKGPSGSTGGYNWSHAETWDFGMNSKDYLYVVVWDDQSVDESWVGQFTFTSKNNSTKTLLSKPDAWEYVITQKGTNPGDWGNTPSNSELNWEISNANWLSAKSRGLNDGSTAPWGRISEVVQDAEFLNTTTNTTGNKRDNERYTIFRTKASIAEVTGEKSVPEPTTAVALLAVGAFGARSALKRKQKVS